MKHVLLSVIVAAFALLCSGCIETETRTNIAADGSCTEIRIIKTNASLDSQMVKSMGVSRDELEQNGYTITLDNSAGKSAVRAEKKYKSIEEYYKSNFMSSQTSPLSRYAGVVSGNVSDVNYYVFRTITLKETMKPPKVRLSSDPFFAIAESMASEVFTETRVIQMPFKITSSNADKIDASDNSAVWYIDSGRKDSEYTLEVTCTYINYPLTGIIVVVILLAIFAASRKQKHN